MTDYYCRQVVAETDRQLTSALSSTSHATCSQMQDNAGTTAARQPSGRLRTQRLQARKQVSTWLTRCSLHSTGVSVKACHGNAACATLTPLPAATDLESRASVG